MAYINWSKAVVNKTLKSDYTKNIQVKVVFLIFMLFTVCQQHQILYLPTFFFITSDCPVHSGCPIHCCCRQRCYSTPPWPPDNLAGNRWSWLFICWLQFSLCHISVSCYYLWHYLYGKTVYSPTFPPVRQGIFVNIVILPTTFNLLQEEPGVIIYENRMTSSYQVGVGPRGSITRDSHFQ